MLIIYSSINPNELVVRDKNLFFSSRTQLKAQADEEALVSLGAVEGQLKSGTLDKIGELIDKHPDAAVSVLKGWVRED